MKNTLYQGQSLRNLLNMSAGDKHVVDKNSARFMGSKKHHRNMGLDSIAQLLVGTKAKGNNVEVLVQTNKQLRVENSHLRNSLAELHLECDKQKNELEDVKSKYEKLVHVSDPQLQLKEYMELS